jgi:hypothetical protein
MFNTRKTGWAPEGTIQKGADGFEDYEEYFRDSSVSNSTILFITSVSKRTTHQE